MLETQEKHTKKAYTAPQLTHYGSLKQLTQAGLTGSYEFSQGQGSPHQARQTRP